MHQQAPETPVSDARLVEPKYGSFQSQGAKNQHVDVVVVVCIFLSVFGGFSFKKKHYFHPYFGEMIPFDDYFFRWVGETTNYR